MCFKDVLFLYNFFLGELPYIKPEDMQYFGKLVTESDHDAQSGAAQKERKIMKLLLKVKNGTLPQI